MVPFGSGGGFSSGGGANDPSTDLTGSGLKLTGLPAGSGDGNSSFLVKSSSGVIVLSSSSGGGGGNVSNTGTPADSQVAVWANADTIEGSSGLTYDGTTLGGKPATSFGAVTGTHGTFGQLTGSSLNLTGDFTTTGDITGDPAANLGAVSGTTLRLGNLTSGRIVYATSNGQLTDDGDLTYDGTTIAGDPAAQLGAVTGTHGTFGQLTGSSLNLTGDFTTTGDITGNPAANLGAVTGTTLRLGNLTSGRVVYATTSGQLTDDGDLTYDGTVLGGKPGAALGAVTGTSFTTTAGPLQFHNADAYMGAVSGSTLRLKNLTSGRIVYATSNGQLTDDADLTFDGTTLGGKPAANLGAVTGTHGTFGQLTGSSLILTGELYTTNNITVQDGNIDITVNSTTDGHAADINFYKSGHNTDGSHTVVAVHERLANVVFHGSDGTDYAEAASIIAEVDGTPGNNDMPGRLIFKTTEDGQQYPSEAVRIDSSQATHIIGDLNATGSGKKLLAGAITGSSIKTTDPQSGFVYNIHSGSITSIQPAVIAEITSSGHSLLDNDVIAILNTEHASGGMDLNSIRGIGNNAYFQHFQVNSKSANTFQLKASTLATSGYSNAAALTFESSVVNSLGSGSYVSGSGDFSMPWDSGTSNNCGGFCEKTTNTRGGTITLTLGAQLNQYYSTTLYLYTNKLRPGDTVLITPIGGNIGLEFMASEIHTVWNYFAITVTNNSSGHLPADLSYTFNWKLM